MNFNQYYYCFGLCSYYTALLLRRHENHTAIGLLFTGKNGDFGLISVTERSCAAPVSKVERCISDRFCVTL